MKRMSNFAVINDNRFNDDVVHVFNLFEADFSCEDCETNQNEYLNDYFFFEFFAYEILILT